MSEVISHIEPKKKWLDVDIKGLWRYRDLYYMYIKRDIVTQYKQTVLGPLWYVIQPLMTTVMYMVVWGGIAEIPTDGVPQPLFYLIGIALWGYFSQCFSSCSDVFGSNAGVFGKVYFPRLVVPASSITSNLIRFLIQFVIFLLAYLYFIVSGKFPASFSVSFLLAPVFIAMLGLHGLSWGLVISSMTTKYRDLKFLISFGVQLLMYATPVIIPLSEVPAKYRIFIELNPLTSIFESFKYSCLGAGQFDVNGLIYSFIFLCVTMFFAVIIFNRTEQRFMDTV